MPEPYHARLVDVVSVLFGRTLKVRYRGSLLGILWSAVSPLVTASVYAAIFGRTFAPYFGHSLVRYAAAVYIGLALAGLFVSGTTQALPSIVQSSGLLNKVRIPFVAFPLSVVAAYGFQQAVGTLPVMVALSLIVNRNPLHVLALALPLGGLAMLTVGIALLVSAADVYFRDVPYLYDLAMFLVMLTSPVFYPAAIVPPQILRFLEVNPLFSIMESARTLILTDGWPPLHALALTLIEGAAVLAAGVAGFRAMTPHFMEEL